MTSRALSAAWVAVLLIGAAGARVHEMAERPIDVDESYSFMAADSAAREGVPVLGSGGYYPRGLLSTYLNAGAIRLFGESVDALRAVSLAFSLALIPLVVLAGRPLFGNGPALLAATLLALLDCEIFYGSNGRMYAQLQFFFTAAFLFLALGYSRDRAVARWLAVAAVAGAALTHQLAVFFLPGALLFFLLPENLRRLRSPGRLAAAAALVVALFVPPMLASWAFPRFHVPAGYSLDLRPGFDLGNFHLAWLLANFSHHLPLVAVVLLAGVGLALDERERPLLYAYLFFAPATVLIAFSVNAPSFRYWYVLIPLYLLAASRIVLRAGSYRDWKPAIVEPDALHAWIRRLAPGLVVAGAAVAAFALGFDLLRGRGVGAQISEEQLMLAGLGALAAAAGLALGRWPLARALRNLGWGTAAVVLLLDSGLAGRLVPSAVYAADVDAMVDRELIRPSNVIAPELLDVLRSEYRADDRIAYFDNNVPVQLRPLPVDYHIRQQQYKGGYRPFDPPIVDPYTGVPVVDSPASLDEMLERNRRVWLVLDSYADRLSPELRASLDRPGSRTWTDPRDPHIRIVLIDRGSGAAEPGGVAAESTARPS